MLGRYIKAYILDLPYAIDRSYDYFVPEEMREKIKVGAFVTLPFGGGNRKKLALVSGVSDSCDCPEDKVKPISSVCSDNLQLTDELLGLCEYLKEQTLCTIGEAVHSMIPAGAFSKLVDYYKPVDNKEGVPSVRDDVAKEIFAFIKGKGSVAESVIKNHFGKNAMALVEKLSSNGWITRETEVKSASGHTTRRKYSLALTDGELEKILTRSSDAIVKPLTDKQAAILVFLSENGTCYEEELISSCSATRARLRSLCEKNLIVEEESIVYRNPYEFDVKEEAEPQVLNEEQKKAFDCLSELAECGEPRAALLHGVTGSGKTCVMTALIDKMLDMGRDVILLLPEISLTPQTISIFCRRYGNKTAVVHSGLSQGERYDAYCRIKNGDAKIVIGTRSAVFSPVKNLGLIIIDEEQELTYKSDQNPKYHARDVARYRCAKANALMLLASATPSLESYEKALEGKYTLIKMKNRYGKAKLPEVMIADMRGEAQSGNTSPIGLALTEELLRVRNENEQSILFLNRRGYNTFVSCRDCGDAIKCPNCSVSLTYHTKKGTYEAGYLTCHWCGYRCELPKICPSCEGAHLSHMGYGTQRVEQELAGLIPDARVLRMDTDTTSTKFSYDELLGKFRRREADILLGTQMVTKGHDFPSVTLVGVLLADASLYLDDYRASERTFSMLTQVIGRAGRASANGKAVIQTNNPDSDVIRLACQQDYETFFEREIKLRRLLVFPPYCDIVLMTLSSSDEKELMVATRKLGTEFARRTAVGGEFSDVQLVSFGPFEAPVYRVDGKYRMRMVVKCKLNKRSRELFSSLLKFFSAEKTRADKPLLTIDFNPSSL